MAGAIDEYLSHLAVERGLAANTLASYRRDLRRYSAYLEERKVDAVTDITEGDVADFLAHLREGDEEHVALSAPSAARTLVAARGFHRFALREGIVETDVAAAVRPPSQPRRLPKALPVESVEALLESAGAPGTALAVRDRALLEMLYGTGARISEAVGLDIDDLDLDASQVLLRGKGGRERVVPVGSFAADALVRYLTSVRPTLVSTRTATGAVFLNSRGGRLSRQSAWAVLTKAARGAGIDRAVSPHTLRHSYATHLLDGGADVRVVQELLGHASVTTTQVYTLVTIDRLREVYATAHPRARA
ncbi:UNVERIFIED_CONTAM: recombinase XerD [Mumia flava]